MNYAVHHFDGSWLESKNPNCNSNLKKKYYRSKFLSYYDSEQIIESLHQDGLFKVKDLVFYVFKRIKKKYFIARKH
jgi:predicted transcriptional regulator YheO